MEIKIAEFHQLEEIIKKGAVALSSIYTAKTKEEEATLAKLYQEKEILKILLIDLKDSLILKERELAQVKNTLVEGFDMPFSNEEEIKEKLIIRIQEQQKINIDNFKALQFLDISSNIEVIKEKIKEIEKKLLTIENSIYDKYQKGQQKKERFLNNSNNLIEKICVRGNITLQEFKALIAGKNIAIKGDLQDHKINTTLSMSELWQLNFFVEIVRERARLEEKIEDTRTQLFQEDMREFVTTQLLHNLGENYYDDNLNQQLHDSRAGKKAGMKIIPKAFIMKLVAQSLRIDPSDELRTTPTNRLAELKIVYSEHKQTMSAIKITQKENKKDIACCQEIMKESRNNAAHCRDELDNLYNELKQEEKIALEKINELLQDPNIHLDLDLAVEKISEYMGTLPFNVELPDREFTK